VSKLQVLPSVIGFKEIIKSTQLVLVVVFCLYVAFSDLSKEEVRLELSVFGCKNKDNYYTNQI